MPCPFFVRHSRAGGNPVLLLHFANKGKNWIPASAGMTDRGDFHLRGDDAGEFAHARECRQNIPAFATLTSEEDAQSRCSARHAAEASA